MKKALISPNELIHLSNGKVGWRVAQVEPANKIFAVADPLFWVDCADDVVQDQFTYDLFTKNISEIPQPQPQPTQPIGDAPNVIA